MTITTVLPYTRCTLPSHLKQLDMESNLLGTLVPIYLPHGKEAKYKYEKNVILKDAKNDSLSKRIKSGQKAAAFLPSLSRYLYNFKICIVD